MWSVILVVISIWLFLRYIWSSGSDRYDLDKIPGPRENPITTFLRSSKADLTKTHLNVQALSKKYGPVVKLPVIGGEFLVVSDYDSIYQVSILWISAKCRDCLVILALPIVEAQHCLIHPFD